MDPFEGDRLVEIGCIELVNHLPTGKTYHQYINPERDMPIEAFNVHGLSEEFLKDFPTFGEIVGEFLDFVGDARLVIHNAAFDMKFINYEIAAFGFPKLSMKQVTDTLMMAREKFPGSPANLDALCRRFNIDNSERTLHGALLDAELLAEVYLELLGGRQHGLELAADSQATLDHNGAPQKQAKPVREARQFDISEKELAAHNALLEELTDPIWKS